MEGIARIAGLVRKQEAADTPVRYRVQVGTFADRENACREAEKLMQLGFDAFVVEDSQ